MAISNDLLGEMDNWVSQQREPRRLATARVDWRGVWPAVLVGLAFLPMLILHARDLWSRPHYQFFPLLLPGAAALLWQSTRRLGPLRPGRRGLSNALLASVWVLLVLDILFVSKWCGAVTAWLALLSAAYALGGARLVGAVLPAWAFLGLAIPLPQQLDAALIAALQDLVSLWSSRLLDVLHVEHVMAGNVVEVADRRLLVDQACSGIYSLLTLLMATAFYLLWSRATGPKAVVLLVATLFWVVAGNVVRVVAVVALGTRFGIDAAEGWRHEVLGLLGFVLMVAMIASTARLWEAAVSFLGRSRRPALAEGAFVREAPPEPTSVPGLRRTVLGAPGLGLAFGLLVVPQFWLPELDWNVVLARSDVYDKAFAPLAEGAVPERAGGYHRTGFATAHRANQSRWGEHSRSWQYAGSSSGLGLSLDYPFVDWHDLFSCYRGQGWKVTPRRPGTGDQAWASAAIEADLENSEGKYGYLAFGVFDERGRPVTPPGDRGLLDTLGERLRSWAASGRETQKSGALSHQIQVFVERVGAPVDRHERARARELFDQARAAIHRETLGVKESRP